MAHELLRAGDKEDCVFIVPKQCEVGDDCHEQQALSARPPPRLAHPRDAGSQVIVDADRSEQQRDVLGIPPSVENERCNGQPARREAVADACQREKSQHDDGKEYKDEWERIK